MKKIIVANCPATVREERADTVGAIPLISEIRVKNQVLVADSTGSSQIYPQASPFGDLREKMNYSI